MRFGIFYEHQLPKPWKPGDEQRLFHEALQQVQLADRLGYDYAWEVEHHFLEEYSHSSAPEMVMAALSQRTRNVRLGHGIVLTPPGYNHPARVAERKFASVPAIMARNPRRARSCFRSGTRAPMPPIWMPTEPMLANPQSAKDAMVKETGSSEDLRGPSCE